MPPYQEFFQRAQAAQIGTIQLSSSSAGLHTPLDTGLTSLLWVRGGGVRAVPRRIQAARGDGEGEREQRCPIKCTFVADAEQTAECGRAAGTGSCSGHQDVAELGAKAIPLISVI